MGIVQSGIGGKAEPFLRLLFIRRVAEPIPPDLAELVCRHSKAILPEPFQGIHRRLLFFPCEHAVCKDGFCVSVLGRLFIYPSGTGSASIGAILLRLILYRLILKSVDIEADDFCFPNDHVLDRLEFLLLGEGQMLTGLGLIVAFQFIPQPIPNRIAVRHWLEFGQLIHDGIHLFFERLLQVAVHLFTCDRLQFL